ncbi:MAG: NFACT family protein [Clostridiales bacterium]|jgi:predicted ribosome quality control (RQC) complex YloA/Tae2 family protein|nr:NFACT family protein [Clostridiales bacterium]
MPNDAVTLKVLVGELDGLLKNGRVEKITMPDKTDVILSVRNNAENYNLLISCAPNLPRIHLTRQKRENPTNAFSFCMLLRKHLEKSIVVSARLLNGDRIVALEFLTKNELKDVGSRTLIFELMSRHSNVVLLNGDGKILGAVRQSFIDPKTERPILTGTDYTPPKNDKIRYFDAEGIKKLLTDDGSGGADIDFLLYGAVCGMSRETISHLLYSCRLDGAKLPLSREAAEALAEEAAGLSRLDEIKSPRIIERADGSSDFFAVDYPSYRGIEARRFKLLNDAADEYYSSKDAREKLSKLAKSLRDVIKKAVDKTQKKLADDRENLLKAKNADQIRREGNLILNNIYLIKKNNSELTCVDYETGETVAVALDTGLTPSENAALRFKKYAKLKRTEESSAKNLAQNLAALEYLKSIVQSIDLADSIPLLREIERELDETNFATKKSKNPPQKSRAKSKNKPKPIETQRPYERVVDGFKIYVGRNNLQNELVTFAIAKNGDVWLHAKNYHGAHVVISTEGRPVPDGVLLAAANLAAYFSKARTAGKAAVDFTERRNVKKIPGAGRGMVIYSDFKTILAEPKDADN